uniref:Dendritic cell-specific transmembrane protein-like domain-containing protein n=1 Tax=Anopheles farauti TaxID=69004 RepID=A0A182Q9M9_9DIPT
MIVVFFALGFGLLARSTGARCVTMLLVPQFLSKRGRAALIGYIFLLTVTGPTVNTMHNVEVLGETLSCTQQQLKVAIRDTLSALKIPFLAMKQFIGDLLQTVERSFMKVQRTLMEVLKLVKRILYSIKKAYNWLRDVVSVCNDKLGTPSERCLQALDKTIDGCKEEMGAMDFLCEVTQVGKTICYGAKMVDYFCELIDFISDSVVAEIEQGIQKLMQNLEELFRVKVEYDHVFDFATNVSKTFIEIGADIRAEIADRTLPLRRSFNVLGMIGGQLFADYALYWLLALIKHFIQEGSDRLKEKSSTDVTPLAVGVSGAGILADTLRDIVRSFEPMVNGTAIDPSQCIPEASAPPNAFSILVRQAKAKAYQQASGTENPNDVRHSCDTP